MTLKPQPASQQCPEITSHGNIKMSWTKIQGEELQRLQERFEIPPQSTMVEASTLRTPFYQNGELVRMHDGTGAMFMVAAGQGELSAREYYPLNGSSNEIRAANEAVGLSNRGRLFVRDQHAPCAPCAFGGFQRRC